MDTQTGGARMARDEWLRQFDEELRGLRAYPGEELVLKIAYAFHGDENPRAAARKYHHQIKSAAESHTPTPTNKPPRALPS
jgi:hypothetical protein